MKEHGLSFGNKWFGATAALVLGIIASGCGSSRSFVTQERLEAGLVVSLDGVGGYNWGPKWLRAGLNEAGVASAIVIYDWSKGPKGMFVGDLVDEARNHAAAKDLAQMVETYLAAMPHRPVTLIGHSGGTAVVVWALENLPEGCMVERAILMAPALAPDYDLSKALRHVRSRMYVMYSYADLPLMAAGTAVFGTMDRQHSVSAGLVGFKLPPAVPPGDRTQYLKVRQIPWTVSLLKMGHLGGHMGWTSSRFARDFIAPILAGKTDPGESLASPTAPAPPGGLVPRPATTAPGGTG
jgi:pimeloyl-ACP methyl ester carboxylesterase